MSGQVKPLRSVFSRLTHKGSPDPKEVDLQKDRRGLKVSVEDLENFSRVMERDFSSIADKYYLCLAADPKIRVTRNKITVTFEIDEGD